MKHNEVSVQVLFMFFIGYLNQVRCELRLPIIVEGPITSNEVDKDVSFNDFIKLPYNVQNSEKRNSEPKPIIENIDIESNITKRLDKTTIKCLVKNPSIRNAQEIDFSIELPYTNYHITNASLQVLGDDNEYQGKNKDEAKDLYRKYSKRNQPAILIEEVKDSEQKSYKEVRLLSMKTNIPAGEKLLLMIEYKGPLMKNGNGTLNHIVHINPHQLVQNFNVNVYVNDSLPITDVRPFEVRNQWPTFKFSTMKMQQVNPKHLHVSFTPNEGVKNEKGYDMNGQFHTSYTPNKNYLLSKVGNDIMDMVDFESMAEYERLADDISAGLEFMFNTFLMLPFIILEEVFTVVHLIISLALGLDTAWLLEPRWYQHELEKEFAKLDSSFGSLDNSWAKLDNEFGEYNNDLFKLTNKWDSKLEKSQVTEKTGLPKWIHEYAAQQPKLPKFWTTKNNLKTPLKSSQSIYDPKKNIFMDVSHDLRPKTISWTASHSGSFTF